MTSSGKGNRNPRRNGYMCRAAHPSTSVSAPLLFGIFIDTRGCKPVVNRIANSSLPVNTDIRLLDMYGCEEEIQLCCSQLWTCDVEVMYDLMVLYDLNWVVEMH